MDYAAAIKDRFTDRQIAVRPQRSLSAQFAGGAGFVTGFILLLVVGALCGPLRAPVILMCLSGAISFGALLHTVAIRDETNPIQFTSFIYLVFFFQLPGIIHLGTQLYPWYGFVYPEWSELRASIVVLVFTIGLLAGTTFGRCPVAARITASRARRRRMSSEAIYTSIVGLSVLSVGAGLTVGYAVIRASRGEASALFDPPTPLTLILSTLATNSAFIALAVASLNFKRNDVSKPWAVLAFFLALLVFLLANNILALPRYAIGAYIISLFFAWKARGPRPKSILLIGLVFAQFTVFPILSDAARGGGLTAFRFDPIGYISNHGDFDGFQSTINVVIYVTIGGLLMGKQLLSAALFFVPRYLFPTKSIGLGGDSATFIGYRFINISSPLPSELYADFGLIGVAVLSTMVGFFIARLDQGYTRRANQGDTFGLLPPSILAGYSFIIMRGSLVGVLGPVIVTILLAVGVHAYIGRPESLPKQLGDVG